MDRLACVDVPALPLQLLLDDHPDWVKKPVAVVAEDKAQALILWVNEQAYRKGVVPGMRLAAALALEGELLADVVRQERLALGLATLSDVLRRFTPRVEASRESPGIFWLDADGLLGLFASLEEWTLAARDGLLEIGVTAAIVVGWSRFGTYAVARALASRGRMVVFPSREQEELAVRKVPLARLFLDPVFVEDLRKLSIKTLGDYLDLPASGIRERFGNEAWQLHRLGSGEEWTPFLPEILNGPLRARIEFETPEADRGALVAALQERLLGMLLDLARREEALAEIELVFLPFTGEAVTQRLVPAEATLDGDQILELVRLRMETLRLPSAIEELHLTVRSERLLGRQALLFSASAGRDLEGAARALARVRAAFGEGCVLRARLAEGHLPESSFVWEEIQRLTPPKARLGLKRRLVRRLFMPPSSLTTPGGDLRNDGWIVDRLERGATRKITGPFVLSGGWWARAVRREYHYAETARGDLLWIFLDRQRRRWFLHGEVR